MSRLPTTDELKLLPDPSGNQPPRFDEPARPVLAPIVMGDSTPPGNGAATIAAAVQSPSPSRQLSELPRDELDHLADEFGLDPTKFKDRPSLVSAIHDRRQLIGALDRTAMLDVVRWGRRPVTASAGKEQIAQEIARIRSMRFAGLSQPGLFALAKLRGCEVREDDSVPILVKKLKQKEGFFARLSRKRRAMVGSLVARIIGEEGPSDYQFLPGDNVAPSAQSAAPTLKEDIEESGLVGGLTNRVKKMADAYLNQKLDEIEARIDRKLDEIDRRLAEWRDKEIASRIRILKITLWASVIVAIVSLIYSYVMEVFVRK